MEIFKVEKINCSRWIQKPLPRPLRHTHPSCTPPFLFFRLILLMRRHHKRCIDENKKENNCLLTLLKVICFSDVDADECHQLKLRQPLSGGGWQRQEISKIWYFGIDEISSQFARSFGRLARIESENKRMYHIDVFIHEHNTCFFNFLSLAKRSIYGCRAVRYEITTTRPGRKGIREPSLAWHGHRQWPFWILLDFPTHQSG